MSLLLGMQQTFVILSYIMLLCPPYLLFLMNFVLMSQTSFLYNSVISECHFYFLSSHIYNSFLFIQSHFIAKLIKTDERDSLVMFIFLIAHPLCFWLWMLGMYNAPVKEENGLCFFSSVSSMQVGKVTPQQLLKYQDISTNVPREKFLGKLIEWNPASTSTPHMMLYHFL